jgi:hypothetical protein
MHALWEADVPPPQWLRLLMQLAGAMSAPAPTMFDLDRLMARTPPTAAQACALVACLLWAAHQDSPPPAITQRLGRVTRWLVAQEAGLGVRAAWLAWVSLTRLARGAPSSLEQVRDRLLGRLAGSDGARDQDLPSFLRLQYQAEELGGANSQHSRAVRQWLALLAEKARRWVEAKGQFDLLGSTRQKTEAYVDLLFAFGLAELGEVEACNRLRERAKAQLAEEDEVHSFLLQAFEYRIRRALEGQPHDGPLPTEQMEYLAELVRKGKMQKVYVIDRMRSLSRILEPDQKVYPYRTSFDDLDHALLELPNIHDRSEVSERVRGLLREVPRGKEGHRVRARILVAALNQAPRVGESFAAEMLALTPVVFDALPPPFGEDEFVGQAALLERGLFVAAHFDLKEYVQQLVARFMQLLRTQRDAPTPDALNSLAAQSFRPLRKLGMNEEIDKILQAVAEVLLRDCDLKVVEDPQWRHGNGPALRALLPVAAGWYFFGRDGEAETVLKAVRSELLAPLLNPKDRTALAKAYAVALSQAPFVLAQMRFEELFDKLEGIYDAYSTREYYSWSKFEVIEAVVLAVATKNFTAGRTVNFWRDDDEILIRRRIHHDARALTSSAPPGNEGITDQPI